MADGKWLTGLTPSMELHRAAELVLTARLESVRVWLPKAIDTADKDPENVHQLRVATRRADAALRVFRDCLPGRIYRTARNRLRTIRKAAGDARDWDVFLDSVQTRLADADVIEAPALDFLLAYGLGQRNAATPAIEKLEQDEPETFEEFIALLREEIRQPAHHHSPATLAALARMMISDRLDRLDQSTSEDLKDYEKLHEVRIAGKRLRYAMEIVWECFVPRFKDELYPLVEQMQETLGRANDSHIAHTRLVGLREQLKSWPQSIERVKAGLEKLIRVHQRKLPAERRKFLDQWKMWKGLRLETMLEQAKKE
jgi:CHAD domain-containing protein